MTQQHNGGRNADISNASNTNSDSNELLIPRTRTTVLAIICLAALILAFVRFLPSTQYNMGKWDVSPIVTEGICFVICLLYSTELNSMPLSGQHTVIPLLTLMLMITGIFNSTFIFVIAITLVCSMLFTRSFAIGIIRAFTALVPVPVVYFIIGDRPSRLFEIFLGSEPQAQAMGYILSNWTLPLLWITLAVPVTRFICDIVISLFCGVNLRLVLREYSITRIVTLAIADLVAIAITILFPAVFSYSSIAIDDRAIRTILSVSLDVYALLLMSFYAVRRIMRLSNSMHCLVAISDMLPLPNVNQEQIVADTITKSLPNIRCMIVPIDDVTTRPGHAYRESQRINRQGKAYVIVFERSVFNRPFLPADVQVLSSAASILNEELRVTHEMRTLRNESDTDPLTGAYTYQSFIAYLRSLQTENRDNKVAIIYLNIDQFRRINQRYGRAAGNTVLRSVTDSIRGIIPENASISRVEGNEFAIVFDGYDSEIAVENLADKLRSATSLPIQTGNGTISISTTTSLSFADSESGFASLLADAGLHNSTNASLDTADIVSKPNEDSRNNQVTLSDTLREAIEQRHMSLLYQPVFSMREHRIRSLTATPLITDSANHRLDTVFIKSEALRLNLGCKLTLDMLEIGVNDLLEFRKITPDLHALAVELNGQELGESHFYEYLETLGKEHPDITIFLEFGETALSTASSEFDDELQDLIALKNVELAITRAGTSYSEVAALSNIPLSAIKLDPGITHGYRNKRAVRLISQITQYAETDGIHLVFDGIDTPGQITLLRSIDGHNAQGNMYASAMSASEMRMRLETMGLDLGEAVGAGEADDSASGARHAAHANASTGSSAGASAADHPAGIGDSPAGITDTPNIV